MSTPRVTKERGLLTTGDVAKRLKVHRSAVWRYIKSGMLKAERVTPRFLGISEASLKGFQKRYIVDSRPEDDAVKVPKKSPKK